MAPSWHLTATHGPHGSRSVDERVAASSVAGHDGRRGSQSRGGHGRRVHRGAAPWPRRAAGAARSAARLARPAALDRHRAGRRRSVVVGARVLAAADDTVQVWAAAPRPRRRPAGRGRRPGRAAGPVRRRRRARAATSPSTTSCPADLELTRSVGAGELLPRAAVGTPDETGLVEVPIAVEPELVPPERRPRRRGRRLRRRAAQRRRRTGRPSEPPPDGPALTGATVVDAPELASSFGTSGKRQLVLAVPEADAPAFFALLARYDAPSLTVVRRG